MKAAVVRQRPAVSYQVQAAEADAPPPLGCQWERPMHLSTDHSHRIHVITHGSASQSNQRGVPLIRGDSLHTPPHTQTRARPACR